MRVLFVFLSVIPALFVLGFMPVKLHINAFLDILKNSLFVQVMWMGIKLPALNGSFEGLQIRFQGKNQKILIAKLLPATKFEKMFPAEVIKKLSFRRMKIRLFSGVSGDAYQTAILTGSMLSVATVAKNLLKADAKIYTDANFLEDQLAVKAKGDVYFSVFGITAAVLIAIRLAKKEAKSEKRKRKNTH